MEGFDYEIKIENSPLNIGTDLNGLNIKNMKLQSTPKVNDFNISFKDDSTNQALCDWVKSISKINENTVSVQTNDGLVGEVAKSALEAMEGPYITKDRKSVV